MNSSNPPTTSYMSHSKLIDYTLHRRDDMPSRSMVVRSSDSPLRLQSRQPSSISSAFVSASSSMNRGHAAQEGDDAAPIEFLFKKTFPQRKRSSELTREELLVECEKRYLQEMKQAGDANSAHIIKQSPRRRSSHESTGSLLRRESKRLGHIESILRSDLTPESKRSVRSLRRCTSEQDVYPLGMHIETQLPSHATSRRSSSDRFASTKGAKAA